MVGVFASGCDWTLFGYDAGNTRNSPDTGISTSNVISLAEAWTHSFGGQVGQIEDSVTEYNHVVYVTSDAALPGESAGTLAALSTTGCAQPSSDCTPTPIWVATTSSEFGSYAMLGTPIVAGGDVYVSNRDWQAAFSTSDSGCVARVLGIPFCTPLQVYDDGSSTASSPLVVNNLLYAPGTGKVFSAVGTGCTDKTGDTWFGAPVPVCEPLWTNLTSAGSSLTNGGTPTVATATAGPYKGDSILYLAAPTSGGLIRVFAYDADGNNGCAVYFLKFCEPLWTDQASGAFSGLGAGAVSVSNGYAYVGGSNPSGQGTLFAFDQNGVTGCTSGICSPEFQTSAGPSTPTPINLAVSGTTVFGTGSGELMAFNGAGCGQASCTGALWSTPAICADGGPSTSTVSDIGGPNVSNGVEYVGITCGSGGVAAYNASGARLWSVTSPDGGAVYNAPIVANGVLYFGTANGSVYAYAP